jgi:hypothetical protein
MFRLLYHIRFKKASTFSKYFHNIFKIQKRQKITEKPLQNSPDCAIIDIIVVKKPQPAFFLKERMPMP